MGGGGNGLSTTNVAVLLIHLFLLASPTVEGNDSWIKVWTADSCHGAVVTGCGCFDLDVFRSFEYSYGEDSNAKPLEYFNERGCVCTKPSECSAHYYSLNSCPRFLNVTTTGSIGLRCKTYSTSSPTDFQQEGRTFI